MKTLISLAVASVLLLPTLRGQPNIAAVLQGEKVSRSLTFSLTGDGSLDYVIDDGSPKTLKDGKLFQSATSEIRLYVDFVNPLAYRLSSDHTTVDNELYQASNNYLTSTLIPVFKFIESSQSSSSASARSIPLKADSPSIERTIPSPQLAEIYLLLRDYNSGFKDVSILSLFYTIDLQASYQQTIRAYQKAFDDLKRIRSKEKIAEILASNQSNLNSAGGGFAKMVNQATQLNAKLETFLNNSKYVDLDEARVIRWKWQNYFAGLEDYQIKLKELGEGYATVTKLFDLTANTDRTQNIRLATLQDINASTRSEVTITVEKVSFDLERLALTVDSKHKFLIHLQRFQRWVPSISTGILYTDMTSPQFSTAMNENGEIVVSKTDDRPTPIVTSGHLNFLYNTPGELNGLIQFGVGPTTERPLLFVGLGVTYHKMALTTGLNWTWQPNLKSLSTGDQVSGMAEINEDIEYVFDSRGNFYVGISYSLNN